MPVMDGLEFSKKVKENFNISHIPFLMLTAKTSSEAKLQSYKIGVDGFQNADGEVSATRTYVPYLDPQLLENIGVTIPADQLELSKAEIPAMAEVSIP